MPIITIDGKAFEVETGKRLVLAIEAAGVSIGHRCGGNARCTTCRVKFLAGEPETMTQAEYERLKERGLLGEVRLSCQIICDHDMTVVALYTAENQPNWEGDTGPTPQASVQPEAKFYPLEELQK
jgi:ferredoxin